MNSKEKRRLKLFLSAFILSLLEDMIIIRSVAEITTENFLLALGFALVFTGIAEKLGKKK